jgi:RluA family pseudouridine synthase
VSSKVPKGMQVNRIDVCAAQIFPELSRKKIKAIIDNGGAFLNKKRALIAKMMVKEGDLIELYWEDVVVGVNQERSFFQEKDILLDHPDFVVISKPAGLPSQATLSSSTDTVAHELAKSFPTKYKIENLLLVHRLDKETSGVMIFAKNTKSQRYFEDLFVKKKIKKTYEAICFFRPKADSGVVDFAIAKDSLRKNAYKAVVPRNADAKVQSRDVRAKGAGEVRSAITRYELKQHFPSSNVSHLVAFPETGRTHQIRVHFQAIGCAILGDKTYSNGVVGHVFGQKFLRHLLHASSVQFVAPDGENQFVESPFPLDFSECLSLLKSREQK